MAVQMWRTSAAELEVDSSPVWMLRMGLKGFEAEM